MCNINVDEESFFTVLKLLFKTNHPKMVLLLEELKLSFMCPNGTSADPDVGQKVEESAEHQ